MATTNVFSNANDSGNVVGNLNGLFKQVYGDRLENLIPDGVKLLNKIPFNAKDKAPGNLFNQPVVLGAEHGVTFGSSTDDAMNLNPPVAGAIKNAEVRGNPIVMRSRLGLNAVARAAQGGKQAFEDATKYLISNMMRSMAKKLEIELLYGQIGYGTVASVATTVVTITTAEWAPGIWVGGENMPIEIRNAAGSTSRGEFKVTSVDLDARTITLDVSAAAAGVVATDVIWHKGAYGNEFAGVHKILTNTGTIFGIDASAYNLFKGNSYSASSGPLSFTKLGKASVRGMEKGQEGKLLALVNHRAWQDMLADQAALRKYDYSYSNDKMDNGARRLVFFSQSGEIEIESSLYVKEGYAYLLNMDDYVRVGSQDISFKRPGSNDDYIKDVENSLALEFLLFSDQALFCKAPGKSTLITAVVNNP